MYCQPLSTSGLRNRSGCSESTIPSGSHGSVLSSAENRRVNALAMSAPLVAILVLDVEFQQSVFDPRLVGSQQEVLSAHDPLTTAGIGEEPRRSVTQDCRW